MLEQYETPMCEILHFPTGEQVLCASTNEPFEDNSNWDGRDQWS